jgi:hypothetical protein
MFAGLNTAASPSFNSARGGEMAPEDRQHLQLAKRHLVDGGRRIDRQRLLIARLRARGQPTELAEQLLVSLQDTLAQMQVHRDYLKAWVDGDRGTPSPGRD